MLLNKPERVFRRREEEKVSKEKSEIVDISTSIGWNFDSTPTGQELVDDRKARELMGIAQKLHAEWRTQLRSGLRSRSHDDIASELFSEVIRILHPANKD